MPGAPGFRRDGVGHGLCCGPVEGGGKNAGGGELLRGDQVRQSPGGGVLHPLGDLYRAAGQRAFEQAGKDQHVVDLVGKVRPSCAHHGGAVGQGNVRHDLGHRVGHGQENGGLGHGLHHLPGDQARPGDADEDISAHQGVRQGAPLSCLVGAGGQFCVVGEQGGVPGAENPILVT